MKEKTRYKLIHYTTGEEIFSAVTHGVGALFGIFATVYMILISAFGGSAPAVVYSAIYGGTLIVLYTMSTLYHAITNKTAKIVFRVMDHTTIFLLIAGTYTPIALLALKGALGWTIFGLEWGIAVLGIVLNSISIEKFKVFSMIGYIISGWAIVVAAVPLFQSVPLQAVIYLLGGGLFYTGGLIFYRMKHLRYMHSVWHIFVLMGSILQFIAIAVYILPEAF